MNWDLFRFSLAKRVFRLIYGDYPFTEWGNDWHRDWCPFHADGARVVDRLFTLEQVVKLVGEVPGDMVECGAWRGDSALAMLRGSVLKRLHVFDSFEGLSEPAHGERRWWRRGDFAATEEEFMENVSAEASDVVVHRGWIPDRFHEVEGERFSFVHVDVDLVAPTRECIKFFFPRLEPGGIMLFDDYGFRQCVPVRRLVDESFGEDEVVKLTTGQAFVVKGE